MNAGYTNRTLVLLGMLMLAYGCILYFVDVTAAQPILGLIVGVLAKARMPVRDENNNGQEDGTTLRPPPLPVPPSNTDEA